MPIWGQNLRVCINESTLSTLPSASKVLSSSVFSCWSKASLPASLPASLCTNQSNYAKTFDCKNGGPGTAGNQFKRLVFNLSPPSLNEQRKCSWKQMATEKGCSFLFARLSSGCATGITRRAFIPDGQFWRSFLPKLTNIIFTRLCFADARANRNIQVFNADSGLLVNPIPLHSPTFPRTNFQPPTRSSHHSCGP